MRDHQAAGLGYAKIQSTRPQTIAYALTDSPAGQLAWIADNFVSWSDPDGPGIDRDRLLTNVSIYWFTRTGASAAAFQYEAAQPWLTRARGRIHPLTKSNQISTSSHEDRFCPTPGG